MKLAGLAAASTVAAAVIFAGAAAGFAATPPAPNATRLPASLYRLRADAAKTAYAPMAPPPSPPAGSYPLPGAGNAVWNPGHWRWSRQYDSYNWVNGDFVKPPTATATTWVPGSWHDTRQGWLWSGGHWERHRRRVPH